MIDRLEAAEETTIGELNGVQGKPVELDGYYRPDPDKVEGIMRPSSTFSETLQAWHESI